MTAGSNDDFDVFFRKESSAVLSLAIALTGSREAAEDLVQDAFIAAHRDWDRIGAYDDPGAWVRRAVANRAVSFRRRVSAEARALIRLGGRRKEDENLRPEDAELWRAVRALPRRQAQILALMYADDLSLPAAAAVLGCSQNTAKTHLRRAKSVLAARLGTQREEGS